jgi:uncharacterized protein (DUF2461 family)
MAFDGFPGATFAWFAGLQADNSKAWFAAHRDTRFSNDKSPYKTTTYG